LAYCRQDDGETTTSFKFAPRFGKAKKRRAYIILCNRIRMSVLPPGAMMMFIFPEIPFSSAVPESGTTIWFKWGAAIPW